MKPQFEEHLEFSGWWESKSDRGAENQIASPSPEMFSREWATKDREGLTGAYQTWLERGLKAHAFKLSYHLNWFVYIKITWDWTDYSITSVQMMLPQAKWQG